MREIKFRIWDNRAKRFAKNDGSLHLNSDWVVGAFDGEIYEIITGIGESFSSVDKNPDHYLGDGGFVKRNRYELQQYTGLKDKNGKEIYEGDILTTSEVDGIWAEQRNSVVVTDIRHPFGNAHLFEIVGNIYENPELK